MLYKYLFIWQLDMPPSGDTGGLFFVKAIQHAFVGLYVQQVCLCALFFLAQDQNQQPAAVPEGALMVVLIAITVRVLDKQYRAYSSVDFFFFQAFFNYTLNVSYTPLLNSLPLTLADFSHGMPKAGEAAYTHDHDHDAAEEHLEGDDTTALVPKTKQRGLTDFEHPCVREPQRPIWIVSDPLGLGNAEVAAMNAAGVEASTIHAAIDEKGNVAVDGFPPGHK
jgi:hypothetical protein